MMLFEQDFFVSLLFVVWCLNCAPFVAAETDELIVRPFRRVGDISVKEFEAVNPAVPTIFTKQLTAEVFDESLWTRESLRQICGNYSLLQPQKRSCYDNEPMESQKECHNVNYVNSRYVGRTWGGLVPANLNDLKNVSTFGELLDAQDEAYESSGQQIVLFDAPLQHHCPDLMPNLRVPKYFGRDYLLLKKWYEDQFKPDDATKSSPPTWPSIIVSKKAGGTFLHADGHTTRFWAQQLSGRKLWRVFDVADSWRLQLSFEKPFFYPQIFEVDAFDPDFRLFPNLKGTTVYETTTEPGETIFIPEGWPHQVVNLEDSVITSVNFMDAAALVTAWEKKRRFDQLCPGLFSAFFMPLDIDALKENIAFVDFFERNQSLRNTPVPQSVIQWVQDGGRVAIDSEWDAAGLPSLHVAVFFDFLPVVQYLLDSGANVNALSRSSMTALDYAELYRRREMRELLVRHGATGRLISNVIQVKHDIASTANSTESKCSYNCQDETCH